MRISGLEPSVNVIDLRGTVSMSIGKGDMLPAMTIDETNFIWCTYLVIVVALVLVGCIKALMERE